MISIPLYEFVWNTESIEEKLCETIRVQLANKTKYKNYTHIQMDWPSHESSQPTQWLNQDSSVSLSSKISWVKIVWNIHFLIVEKLWVARRADQDCGKTISGSCWSNWSIRKLHCSDDAKKSKNQARRCLGIVQERSGRSLRATPNLECGRWDLYAWGNASERIWWHHQSCICVGWWLRIFC